MPAAPIALGILLREVLSKLLCNTLASGSHEAARAFDKATDADEFRRRRVGNLDGAGDHGLTLLFTFVRDER